MTYATRDTIVARLQLAERDEESIPLGGVLRLSELTRAAVREASTWSATTDAADRERVRGAVLATAIAEAAGDADQTRQALTTYSVGAPAQVTDLVRWNAAVFAAGVVDPETRRPIFTRDEVLVWPNRPALWDEVMRVAQLVLDLSEVGQASLKSGDPEAAAE